MQNGKKSKIGSILLGIGAVCVVLRLVTKGPGWTLGAVVFLLVGAIVDGASRKRYQREVRGPLVQEAVEAVFPGASYTPDSGIGYTDAREAAIEIAGGYDLVTSRDGIGGTYNGLPFQLSTVWLGLIGGLDDYIKVFRHRKEGLKGRFKIVGQVGLGVIVGTTMWLSPDIVVREKVTQPVQTVYLNENGTVLETVQRHVVVSSESLKTTQTTIPFVKNNEFDYGWLTGGNSVATWILYVLVAIFVVTAVSNGANLTDGLDGLATGVSVPIVAVLGVLAYLSGHIVYADYLNIMYIPGSGEMVVFAAALVGALVGFLWYNSFPAQIFMGDTGSLAIGGVIAVFALCIRKELLLPLLCGVFLVESFSVMMQVGWFKYTKRRYGEGRRILLMSPVHHHYQKKGIFETKIVLRFWIISLLLAAITLVTLKIR